MPRIILIVALIIVVYMLAQWLKKGYQRNGRPFAMKAMLTAVAVVFVLLAAAGRVHWVGAMLASAVAGVRYILPLLLRSLPFLQSLQRARAESTSQQQQSQTSPTEMNINEALETLGLQAEPSKKEIIDAHRKLIQKLHPDRGGNDYLAAKINQAKDLLLKQYQ